MMIRYLFVFILFFVTSSVSANTLLESLTSQLGVTSEQATGGAGALFNLTKSKVSQDEFSQIAAVVPGIEKLMQAAPVLNEGASDKGALTSMLGDDNKLGSIATLASSFGELGLSSDMVTKFSTVIFDYLKQAGGESVMKLMKNALAM
jgi:hypothetical protein